MVLLCIVGILAVIAAIVYGSIQLYEYARDRYSYQIFNMPSMLLFGGVVALVGLVCVLKFIGAGPDGNAACASNLNVWIAAVLVSILIAIMFVRNWVNTSIPVAIGALFLQMTVVAGIVVAAVMAIFGVAGLFGSKDGPNTNSSY